MAQEYDKLGIEINAIDNASKTLQKISDLLSKIQKQTQTTQLSSSIDSVIPKDAVGKITQVTQALGKSAEQQKKVQEAQDAQLKSSKEFLSTLSKESNEYYRLENSQLTYKSSLEALSRAQISHQNAVIATNKALETQRQAQYDLSNAQLRQDNAAFAIRQVTAVGGQITEPLANNYAIATNNVEKAQIALAKANETVISAQNSENKSLSSLISAQNNASKSSNNLAIAQNRIKEAQNKVNQTFEKAKPSVLGYFGKLSALYFLVRRTARAIFNMVKESASFVENLNLFGVTFGKNYKKTLDWAVKFSNELGVSSKEIVRFTGLFKQLATSIGIAEDTGDLMSKTLTQLGYDLASLYDISTEAAFEKLQAGIFSGQTKPLRSIGLDITAQTLDNLLKTNEAFANMGVTSSKALLQSDKAMLRLIVVLQNAQNSFGDMQKTINTLANQTKVFQGSLLNLKLAIGDALQEPMRVALIYINGFIIGLTQIIRAFVPMSDEAANAAAGMKQFADETEDAVDAINNQGKSLDIDAFRSLSEKDGSQLSITKTITEELKKQIALYDEQVKNIQAVTNQAVELGKKFRDFFIVVDEKGAFVSWTDSAKALHSALLAIVGLGISKKIVGLIGSIQKITLETNALTLASNVLATSGIFLIIYSLSQLIGNWDKLNTGMKVVYSTTLAIGVVLTVLSNKTLLKTLISALTKARLALFEVSKATVTTKLAFVGLGAVIGMGIGTLLNKLPNAERLIIGITVAIGGLIFAVIAAAKAVGAFQMSWSLGIGAAAIVAGIVAISSAIDSMANEGVKWDYGGGFANGGITDANLIMTHENGAREWVGKQGSSTAVVNDSQMSTVMSRSVRDGVLEALSYNVGSDKMTIVVQANLDGEKVYESTRKVARRHGEKFTRV